MNDLAVVFLVAFAGGCVVHVAIANFDVHVVVVKC